MRSPGEATGLPCVRRGGGAAGSRTALALASCSRPACVFAARVLASLPAPGAAAAPAPTRAAGRGGSPWTSSPDNESRWARRRAGLFTLRTSELAEGKLGCASAAKGESQNRCLRVDS